jgi:predicted nucleic acid-binding Zn ribbon protein
MSDEPRASCPECGEESERLLSGGAGFLFKGNGFYITDYRSDSYKKEASEEKSPGSTPKKKSDGGKKDKTSTEGSSNPAGSSTGQSSGGSASGQGT